MRLRSVMQRLLALIQLQSIEQQLPILDTIAIGSNANAATIGAIAIGRDTGVNVSGGPNDSTANNITIGHTARAGDDNITRVRDLCKIPFSPTAET